MGQCQLDWAEEDHLQITRASVWAAAQQHSRNSRMLFSKPPLTVSCLYVLVWSFFSFKDLRTKSCRLKSAVSIFPAPLMPRNCLNLDATMLFQRDTFTVSGHKTAVSAYFRRAVTEVNDFKAHRLSWFCEWHLFLWKLIWNQKAF